MYDTATTVRHAISPFGTPGFEGFGSLGAPTAKVPETEESKQSPPESESTEMSMTRTSTPAQPRKMAPDASFKQAANINGMLLSATGAAVAGYHGYKRYGNSVGWGAAWGIGGLVFPVIAVAVALGQGVGKRR